MVIHRAKLRWYSWALWRNKVKIQIAFFCMKALTCVNENCKPVIENMSSAVVMMMYWGSNHSMCTLFAGVTVVKFPTCSTNNSSVVTNTILYGMQEINANTYMDLNLYSSKIIQTPFWLPAVTTGQVTYNRSNRLKPVNFNSILFLYYRNMILEIRFV